jgi:hypothetical protein
MEKYSHGPFEVSGYKVTIHGPVGEWTTVMDAWRLWFTENMGDRVIEKEYPTLHAVYYNYKYPLDGEKNEYDMIIGYITKTDTLQTDPTITTVKIPTQDYRYTTLDDISPESIFGAWSTVNSTPASLLARSYGYDLDMYNETHTGMTIAVSVNE